MSLESDTSDVNKNTEDTKDHLYSQMSVVMVTTC